MARRLLWASLALAPVTIATRVLFHAGDVLLFVLAAAALVPLAWLIGEATEQAAEHTGSGVGGFLNASFGNAPELIIALFAVENGLPDVVRGSLTGSIVSNILLVLGFALVLGPEERFDRTSLLAQLGLVGVAVLAFLVPAVPGFHGNADRHSLALLTLPVAVFLLVLYGILTTLNLRRHRRAHLAAGVGPGTGWRLPTALLVLGIATLATALISEILVHSLHGFAHSAGLSEFFIAAVIVAIVGNAAEHGGAIVIARRGNLPLATEIAVSSSAQVALLIVPAVALASFAFRHALPLSFRPIELLAMGIATAIVAAVVWDGRSRKWEGFVLLALYVVAAGGFWIAGDR